MIRLFFFFCLFSLPETLLAVDPLDKSPIAARKAYGSGAVFMHIAKAGGTTILGVFRSEFNIHTKGHPHNLEGSRLGNAIEKSTFSAGHVNLRDIVAQNKPNRPTITFFRSPFEKLISALRYLKSQAPKCPSNHWIAPYGKTNLNSLSDVKMLVHHLFGMADLNYCAPPGLDVSFDTMTDEKVDKCVNYALQNIAFFGDIDDLSGSLHKMNAALNLNINVAKASQEHANRTPDRIEKITNPDVLAYLKDRVKWSEKLYAKLIAAQRWRVAVPNNPKKKHSPFVQYVMPEGFDPDRYIALYADLKKSAKSRFLKAIEKSQKAYNAKKGRKKYQRPKHQRKLAKIQANIEEKRYEVRKWAMLHYVTQGQKQGRAFQ